MIQQRTNTRIVIVKVDVAEPKNHEMIRKNLRNEQGIYSSELFQLHQVMPRYSNSSNASKNNKGKTNKRSTRRLAPTNYSRRPPKNVKENETMTINLSRISIPSSSQSYHKIKVKIKSITSRDKKMYSKMNVACSTESISTSSKSCYANCSQYLRHDYKNVDLSPCEPLTLDTLTKLRCDFYADPKNELAQNVCTRFDPFEVAICRKKADNALHVYNIKVESEGKPVTNQENSGRCWLFAALNVMRLPFIKKYNLDEFEFSQSYLFFWDKIERAHYWLNNIVQTAKQGEDLEGRLVNFLLKDPVNDGGQWDMIVNIINKYGVMPKKFFPESFSSKRSLHMNALIKTKLREFAKELRDLVAKNASDASIQDAINSQVRVIYNIVCTCLGTPPETFTFEYYTKDKSYKSFGSLSPQQFYDKYVKQLFNVNDKVCLVSDPRASNPFGKLYTLQCLGNVVGGRQTAYNNQPIDTLMKVVKDSLEGGEAVWFGCEVSKRFERKNGLEDLDAHDYRLVFNTEVQIGLNKADRLMFGDSCMTHAMVFTACGTDAEGNPKKFRVENSYSDKEYDKGYLLLTEPWFREFVFEVVVDKKFVPSDVLEVFKQEPKVLPAWDPMGTLACTDCSKE